MPECKTCKIKGCNKPHEGLGFCGKHYQRFKKHGDPHRNDRTKYKTSICKVTSCKGKRWCGPYCMKHYYRWKREGSALYQPKRGNYPKICTSCKERPSVNAGMCHACYQRNVYRKSAAYKKRRKELRNTLHERLRNQKKRRRRKGCGKNVDVTTVFLLELWESTTVCSICNNPLGKDRHLDHIIPLNPKGGGKHEKNNIRYVHPYCNISRPHDGSDLRQ